MITRLLALQNAQASWEAVRLAQSRVEINLNSAALQTSHEFKNFAYNLVLVFAYAVLEDVVRQLQHEGAIPSQRQRFKDLLADSQSVLSWRDFTSVDEGRQRRNDIAHRRFFIERADCWRYIDKIEDELIAWGVVPASFREDPV
ncbi:MAG: hypothetical protein ACREXY_23280 [Gammaproteobacteria bacterium]